jgi:polyisoprenoid-binding protein YceI
LRSLTSEQGDTPQAPAGGFNPLDALPSRDGVVLRRLDTDAHPLAEFTATEITGLPARYVEGQEARVQVPGNLTIRGVTRPVVLDTKATLRGTELSGAATTRFNMSDFGVDPPAIAAVRVEDPVTIVVEFTAVAGS